jgi:multidrug efflux pump subunit AcrB
MSDARLGPAGRLARFFIDSKLTPLIVVASILLGAFALRRLPREEEPQIVVPMIDVFVELPGASPKEIERRVAGPLEKLFWELPGVEYVYSTSSPGRATIIVRSFVGEDANQAIVRLHDKLMANRDALPAGASQPTVKLRSIDDVPIFAVTLSSRRYGAFPLRRLADEVKEAVKQVPDVSEVTIIGGDPRRVRVELDPDRMAARGLSPVGIAAAVQAVNFRTGSGSVARENRELLLETGWLLRDVGDVERVVVGVSGGRPVFLRDVARVIDGGAEPADYVLFGAPGAPPTPAVTLTVAKRHGTNAIDVVHAVERKLAGLRGSVLPDDVTLTVTRNTGETAAEKSNELLLHMLIAVVSVSLLVLVALGAREAAIVLLAIPATLSLTLFVFSLYGYTLNRITLFALIFSIGILVDDAIVVVENIARWRGLPESRDRPLSEVAVRAVDEVGNPTILATLTVIAAILPMAFVGGLMGPYMRPIPIGASAAMVFSLLVAFIVTPWAAIRLLGAKPTHHAAVEGRLTRTYRRAMRPLIRRPAPRVAFLVAVVGLLLFAVAFIPLEWVRVKMLPFDNKSELQVVVDMPEGTTLEETARVTQALADEVQREPEVTHWQAYVGTAGPYNFNGLVRHYFLRRGPNVADVQVNLVDKSERKAQSHAIAKRLRERLQPVAARFGARIKIAEVPPGPPVLQTLVAEIYGPDDDRQVAVARDVRDALERIPGVVDVDWYVEDPQPKILLSVDQEKAALSGVSPAEVARALRLAISGEPAGVLHAVREREEVPIVLRLDRADRASLARLSSLRVAARDGELVPVGELIRTEETVEDRSIHHKNLMPVVYVTGDVAGQIESPVYAILKLDERLAKMRLPEGYTLRRYTAHQPFFTDEYALKWDGEWHITYEVFRDLGIAFAIVLVLIYILVVAWFESLLVPLVIMSAIPFSLVGILPGHAALGAFFTATSMIGFIAGAGIVVRNSIILVDFIELRRREGMALEEAVIDAGAVRFRPMLLTAAAVVVGASVILFDPIFQGLAISLMAGEIASLLLSRVTVPVVYALVERRRGRA